MPTSNAATRNRLIMALSPECQAKVRPKLVPATLSLGQNLYLPYQSIDSIYFPESGIISLVTRFADGVTTEVGVVGREGMLGTPLLSGIDSPFTEAMVQGPGAGFRMSATAFRQELDDNPEFRSVMLRYHEYLIAQISQTAVCNSRHGLAQRLARWLLMAHDRYESDKLPLTQEFIAVMLGVHRPSLTIVIGILRRAGLIRSAGGMVTVLDRDNLQAACCECYTVVRARYSCIFPTITLP